MKKINLIFRVSNYIRYKNVCIYLTIWCGPKVGTQKENMERGLEVRKIYLQKLQRIVSNIGSRTSSTLVLLLLLLSVLG